MITIDYIKDRDNPKLVHPVPCCLSISDNRGIIYLRNTGCTIDTKNNKITIPVTAKRIIKNCCKGYDCFERSPDVNLIFPNDKYEITGVSNQGYGTNLYQVCFQIDRIIVPGKNQW